MRQGAGAASSSISAATLVAGDSADDQVGTGGHMSVAERYVEAVNNADTAALLSLFAEDATLLHPVGTDTGLAEIAEFHNDVIFAGQVRMSVVRSFEHDNIEVVQLEGSSPLNEDTTVHTVDIFTLNGDGLVQTLDIYYR
jgi:hypothetical protein